MAKKNKIVLKGHLTEEPDWGFDYAKTRSRITGKILAFTHEGYSGGESKPFKSVIDFEVKEDGEFELSVRTSTNFLAKDRADGTKEEEAVCKLLGDLQSHCGIGTSKPEEKGKGVRDVAYLSGMKYEDD